VSAGEFLQGPLDPRLLLYIERLATRRPGIRLWQIARRLGISKDDVEDAVVHLVATGRLLYRKKGGPPPAESEEGATP